MPSIRASRPRPSHPVLPSLLETSREILLPKKHVDVCSKKKGQIESYHTYHKYCIVIHHSFIRIFQTNCFQEKTHAKTCFFSKWCEFIVWPCRLFAQSLCSVWWSCPFSLRVEATQWWKTERKGFWRGDTNKTIHFKWAKGTSDFKYVHFKGVAKHLIGKTVQSLFP